MTKPITHRPLKPRGRKPTEPPSDAVERIATLSATGYSKIGVAADLGVDVKTLNRWLDENPELNDAFDAGRERERQSLHNKLYEKAMAGDTVAALFLLKSRHGYREGDQASSANRVSIQFNLPAAMPLEQFKVIEHDRDGNDRLQPIPAQRSIPARRD
jgi:hypothetical protein